MGLHRRPNRNKIFPNLRPYLVDKSMAFLNSRESQSNYNSDVYLYTFPGSSFFFRCAPPQRGEKVEHFLAGYSACSLSVFSKTIVFVIYSSKKSE